MAFAPSSSLPVWSLRMMSPSLSAILISHSHSGRQETRLIVAAGPTKPNRSVVIIQRLWLMCSRQTQQPVPNESEVVMLLPCSVLDGVEGRPLPSHELGGRRYLLRGSCFVGDGSPLGGLPCAEAITSLRAQRLLVLPRLTPEGSNLCACDSVRRVEVDEGVLHRFLDERRPYL